VVRIGHAADLHLGHRRYDAMTPALRNQREQDCSDAWAAAVDGMLKADVQLVLVAGDVFDTGRCSMLAVADAVRGVQRLVAKKIPVLIAAGNHDTKGTAVNGASGAEYHGSPLLLLHLAGARVAAATQRITLKQLNCHVLLVPDRDVDRDADRVELAPSADAGTHLLCAHGKFSAKLYRLPEAQCIDPASISDQFTYCALGDFHVASEVRPNAHYSGSTEWTSSNVWAELAGTPKGWRLVDTDAGTVEHITIPTRPHFDLPQFSAHSMTPEDITAKLLEHLAAVAVQGAVLRQVIHDVPRGTMNHIDRKALKAAHAGALQYKLDDRRAAETLAGKGFRVTEPETDWLDEFNRDEPLPQDDDYSYADDLQKGRHPLLDHSDEKAA
jgi:DNA repair exonuclease SbcCD nuclease subunit